MPLALFRSLRLPPWSGMRTAASAVDPAAGFARLRTPIAGVDTPRQAPKPEVGS